METCLICKKEIISFSENSSHRLLINHLKNEHNITQEKYIIIYKLNNVRPVCACGCGYQTRFLKGKFIKYYKNHKDHLSNTKESINKGLSNKIKNYLTLEKRLLRLNISKDQLNNYYNDFINMKISLKNISREIGIDKRIIKKYWKELNLIKDKEVFNRILRKHQGYWSETVVIPDEDEIDKINNILPEIYSFITNERHTFNEVKIFYQLKCTSGYLHKILVDNYGEKINKFLKLHNSSNIETEFYNILNFYFNGVNRQFKLDDRIYDYIIKNKILIEFDGEYWHNEKTFLNDEYKYNLAIDNGYYFFRIKEKECKNIDILYKIKEKYDKINKI